MAALGGLQSAAPLQILTRMREVCARESDIAASLLVLRADTRAIFFCFGSRAKARQS